MFPASPRPRSGGASFRWGPRLTPCVKWLLISNGAVFLLQYLLMPYLLHYGWGIPLLEVAPRLTILFGISRETLLHGFLWQPVTYLFLHGDALHLFFNLLALWMFGSDVEGAWGWKAFLRYFLVCGVGAGLLQVALFRGLTVGASGAVYGILVAFAVLYPRRPIYIWGILPIPARALVAFYIGIEAFLLWRNDGVAHLAHLGGAGIGWLYLHRAWNLARFIQEVRWKLRRRRFRSLDAGERREDDPRYWN